MAIDLSAFDESSPANLIEPCNKRRVVLSRWAHASLTTWLTVQAFRSARVIAASKRANLSDASDAPGKLEQFHEDRIGIIRELIRRIPERVTMHDWFAALDIVYPDGIPHNSCPTQPCDDAAYPPNRGG